MKRLCKSDDSIIGGVAAGVGEYQRDVAGFNNGIDFEPCVVPVVKDACIVSLGIHSQVADHHRFKEESEQVQIF